MAGVKGRSGSDFLVLHLLHVVMMMVLHHSPGVGGTTKGDRRPPFVVAVLRVNAAVATRSSKVPAY
jgi:hypothetical protein